jgi:hypothetical protein
VAGEIETLWHYEDRLGRQATAIISAACRSTSAAVARRSA